jgi:hypothetical protein
MNKKYILFRDVCEIVRLAEHCGRALRQTSIYLKFLKPECNHVSLRMCAFTGELNFKGSASTYVKLAVICWANNRERNYNSIVYNLKLCFLISLRQTDILLFLNPQSVGQ